MPTVTRRLLTVHLPINAGTLAAIVNAVTAVYPGTVLDSGDEDVHLTITEQLDDDDELHRRSGLTDAEAALLQAQLSDLSD